MAKATVTEGSEDKIKKISEFEMNVRKLENLGVPMDEKLLTIQLIMSLAIDANEKQQLITLTGEIDQHGILDKTKKAIKNLSSARSTEANNSFYTYQYSNRFQNNQRGFNQYRNWRGNNRFLVNNWRPRPGTRFQLRPNFNRGNNFTFPRQQGQFRTPYRGQFIFRNSFWLSSILSGCSGNHQHLPNIETRWTKRAG